LRVLDLGAAPGGWTQVALERVGLGGKVFSLDNREWEEVAGATCLTFDFLDSDAPERLLTILGGPIDVVLSDMAAPSTGHSKTDHIRIIALAEEAWNFAEQVLSANGTFVCKVFQGGTEGELLKKIRNSFTRVTHNKPPASRKESAEVYLVAKGFKKSKESVAVS
jgi:23S rRNA (uridine2552-2'-O)-methyltransferase